MSSFELSQYQKDILDFIQNKDSNLLVDAKAGSGKTSTLIMISNEIIRQNKKCLFLAFNKSIVEELQRKITHEDCMIKTLHSLGLSFIRSYLYRKHNNNYNLNIDTNDSIVRDSVKSLFESLCLRKFELCTCDLGEKEQKELYNHIISEICNMVNFCRLYNVNYNDELSVYNLGKKLCYNLPQYNQYGIENYPEIIRIIIDNKKQNFENPQLDVDNTPTYTISYTDMIYFPVYYKMYPPFNIKAYLGYVLCDECQDLSVLQQLFLKRLSEPNTRFIFVGDEKQSIYGFAGADTKSVENLKNHFDLTELPLNICYRCPENIIKVAQSIVPSIDWNHNREDKGNVIFTTETDLIDQLNPR